VPLFATREQQEPEQWLHTDQLEEGRPYQTARDMVLRGDADGVGWVVTGETEWVWLDLDKCRDPASGKLEPWAEISIAELDLLGAYVEISPSGTGMHALGRATGLDAPLQSRVHIPRLLAGVGEDELAVWGGSRACHRKAAIEIFYACTRFVCVTGWGAAGGGDGRLAEHALGLHATGQALRPAWASGSTKRGQSKGDWLAPIEDVISALAVIPNDDSVSWDDWVVVGMAVYNATNRSEEGLLAWCAWSAKCEKHDEDNCAQQWLEKFERSPPDNIGFGWLAKKAKEIDKTWRRPSRLPEVEFDVEEDDPVDAQPGVAAAPFAGLLERIAYVPGMIRWFDGEDRRIMKELDLMDLAGRLGIKGHSEQGKKSIAARLRGARDPAMKRLAGLACMPGKGAVVEGVGVDGRRGLLGNLWIRGGIAPCAGDVTRHLEHAAWLIPNADDLARVFDFQAFILQHPGVKINHAIVLLGGQLNGKDTFLQPFVDAIGEHNINPISGLELGGTFNNEMTKQMLRINEMPSSDKRDNYEKMKPLLAAPPNTLRINDKNTPVYWIPNIINVIITTNLINAIALADDDRRFDVVQTQLATEGTKEEVGAFYTAHHRWLRDGGSAAVAAWLLARDVSAFNPHQAPPRTAAKIEMTRASSPLEVRWVLGLLEEGGELADRQLVSVDEIMDMARHGGFGAGPVVANRITSDYVGRALKLAGWHHIRRVREGDQRHRIWASRGAELLEQLGETSPKQLIVRLEADRKRVSGSEF
jgi:hypothetical protein